MIGTEFRLDYAACRDHLLARIQEPAPSRIQIVTGPRQVGKTTLLLEIAAREGESAIYAAGDEPAAALPGHWERIWDEAEDRSRSRPTTLLLDEVHLFPDWAARLKGRWDRLRRRRLPVQIVASGSSALRVAGGSRESLAGRFERLTLTHWSAASVSASFLIPKEEAARLTVSHGSYPGAIPFRHDPPRFRAYVRDAILEPALGRDVLALGLVRRPALLRQVFAVAAGAPAQVVSLQKLQGALQDGGALETIAHYLELLSDAYLIAPLEKFASTPARRRSAPPKLVTLSNALLGAVHAAGPPDPLREPSRYGAWVENACLAFAVNQGQRVTWWREEPLEVDAVIEGSWGSWAVEVKTGAYESLELRGLAELCRRHAALRPLVLTSPGREAPARRAGLLAMSWPRFLLEGPVPE